MTVECPYCEKENRVNHDDGYGYQEDEIYNQECEFCEKTFAYDTSIMYWHNSHKADCLNGSPHKYQPTKTHPPRYTKMECIDCGDVRPCTPQELDEILEATS